MKNKNSSEDGVLEFYFNDTLKETGRFLDDFRAKMKLKRDLKISGGYFKGFMIKTTHTINGNSC